MKLKLTAILLIMIFNLHSQSNDTLIVNPNPFDSIADIQFTIANNDTIWLDIYNSVGSSIKTFYNATVLPSGTYSVVLNGDTLPNGIYFVVLKINSTKTISIKLIKQNNAVGLKENDLLNNLLLYPNPTTSTLSADTYC